MGRIKRGKGIAEENFSAKKAPFKSSQATLGNLSNKRARPDIYDSRNSAATAFGIETKTNVILTSDCNIGETSFTPDAFLAERSS